ncbi:UNVERIFIED_CONTAM: hypothetical protein GTU68_004726 [Idotea baltica]|nr:hypothetical protein [Idotea baltica]
MMYLLPPICLETYFLIFQLG